MCGNLAMLAAGATARTVAVSQVTADKASLEGQWRAHSTGSAAPRCGADPGTRPSLPTASAHATLHILASEVKARHATV